MRPLIKQIEIFSRILTIHFNCKYFSIYTRDLLGGLLGTTKQQQYNSFFFSKYTYQAFYKTLQTTKMNYGKR